MSTTADDLRDDLVVLNPPTPTSTLSGDTRTAVDTLRFLAADAVEKANSGHPGTPMALAPLAYRLFTRYMKHDPADPHWFDRDRFVLSIGHACMLLYGSLHLAGYDLTIDDLKRFRQWGSRTPGHPERDMTPGVDINTGPLGQGVANGVGFAVAEKMLAARYNRPGLDVVDHRTWVICGDGDMMEGIASEAASIGGRLGVDKLTMFYDSNRITLESSADIEFREDVAERFEAYGWHVQTLESVDDLDTMDALVDNALAEGGKPSLIVVHSHIGYGSPKQDTAAAHGAPLGEEALAATRRELDWSYGPFEIPDGVYDHWRTGTAKGEKAHRDWESTVAELGEDHADLAAELSRVMAGELAEDFADDLPSYEPGQSIATRNASGDAINALAPRVPELVGGSADTTPSTKTIVKGKGDINTGDWTAPNIHFGVREHAMGAITNAMAAHGGLRPYCSTFFVFTDYMRGSIRLSALMELPVVYVMTHDSIGVGEDGPTHQPVEHLASFRAMPGLRVIRPADANETAEAWALALEHHGPTLLVLSRQGLPVLDPDVVDVASGASVVAPGNEATIVATGSEVGLALAARDVLARRDIEARVVSMPCWELFRELDEDDQEAILPADLPTLSVEAGATMGWLEFADDALGIDHFGASAPAAEVYEHFGLTPERVADRVGLLIEGER